MGNPLVATTYALPMTTSRFCFAIRSVLKRALFATPGIAALAASALLCARIQTPQNDSVLQLVGYAALASISRA
ncbi:hypothetical protein B0G73_13928 [Paraburkholderia sp. BL25I1N1]|nr:hypothetical protein B0G73_13928 [Paraburkholderia sp. BL25I1N1]